MTLDAAARPAHGRGGQLLQPPNHKTIKPNMIRPDDILTDKDVAKIAGMRYWTFQQRMRTGFRSGELNWNAARPVKNGRERVWLRRDVERVWRDRITAGESSEERSEAL